MLSRVLAALNLPSCYPRRMKTALLKRRLDSIWLWLNLSVAPIEAMHCSAGYRISPMDRKVDIKSLFIGPIDRCIDIKKAKRGPAR
jgi:hypothetical protein